MDLSLLHKAKELKSARRAFALVTELHSGKTQIVEGRAPTHEKPAEGLEALVADRLRSNKAGTQKFEDKEIFINPCVPSPRLVVIGAVHITQALVPICEIAALDLIVIDPRTSFASPDRFDGVKLYAQWPQELKDVMALDPYTALAAITHDPKIDDFPLIEALNANCFYVGALGSRKTHAKREARLLDAGLRPEQISQIKAPIGLSIGSATPGEIAIAIGAQIIESLRRPKQ